MVGSCFSCAEFGGEDNSTPENLGRGSIILSFAQHVMVTLGHSIFFVEIIVIARKYCISQLLLKGKGRLTHTERGIAAPSVSFFVAVVCCFWRGRGILEIILCPLNLEMSLTVLVLQSSQLLSQSGTLKLPTTTSFPG